MIPRWPWACRSQAGVQSSQTQLSWGISHGRPDLWRWWPWRTSRRFWSSPGFLHDYLVCSPPGDRQREVAVTLAAFLTLNASFDFDFLHFRVVTLVAMSTCHLSALTCPSWSKPRISLPTLLVLPLSISCLCLKSFWRAKPLPLSSSPCVNTPSRVLLPASTLPTTATLREQEYHNITSTGSGKSNPS